MKAGTARIDITPSSPVWMAGMIRSHKSTGIKHRLYAKALALSSGDKPADTYVIASVDLCGFSREDYEKVYETVAGQTGISADHMILAATHTHSGPSTSESLNPKEEEYTKYAIKQISEAICQSIRNMQSALIGCASGTENTISHYRRLLAKDGHVIMNWEPYTPEEIVGPLGEIDPEVGVLKAVSADSARKPLALLFNHAGHPNVMSGDNYLLSSEYPGLAESILEKELGCTSIFVNGAQGTMDIDGLKDRDWSGMDRVAGALAEAVKLTSASITVNPDISVHGDCTRYTIPARQVSQKELDWAKSILAETKGKIKAVADGVGDDYKATLLIKLHSVQDIPHKVEQICIVTGDTAWLSFTGEMFTEIGMRIKRASPFAHTYIIGLANGKTGYIPTRKAIREGGYAVDTRRLDDSAEDIIFDQSISLLKRLHSST